VTSTNVQRFAHNEECEKYSARGYDVGGSNYLGKKSSF
jgi:hypothetical protein